MLMGLFNQSLLSFQNGKVKKLIEKKQVQKAQVEQQVMI
jgi:hypothetical protein